MCVMGMEGGIVEYAYNFTEECMVYWSQSPQPYQLCNKDN